MSAPVPATTLASLRIVVILCLAGMLGGAVLAAAIIDTGGEASWLSALFPLVAVHWWVSGVIIGARRPANRISGLMLVTGLTLFITQFAAFEVPVLTAIGLVLQTLPLGLFIHVLLALPGGRLETTFDRRFMILTYVLVIVGTADSWLFAPGLEGQAAVLRAFVASPELAETWRWIVGLTYTAFSFVAAWRLLRRRARFTVPQLRTLGPLYVTGALAVTALPLVPNVGKRLLDWSETTVGLLQLVFLALPPLALLLALRRGGFSQVGGVEGLARALGPGRTDLAATEARLGAALGDPSVRISMWSPEAGGHVSPAGELVRPGTGVARGVVEVRRAGELVGAIDYDQALGEDPAMVHAAAEVIALALEQERLTAQLRISNDQVRRSRERVVEAADRERRRIAQDLHDGLQARLVLLAIQARTLVVDDAGQATAARALHQDIDGAIDELRGLVQGVMPSALIERDLAAAIDDLVDRMPLSVDVIPCPDLPTLPSVVESTLYFVVAEAFSNAIKHAGASRLRVRLRCADGCVGVEVEDDGVGGAVLGRDGLGLPGLQDRVDALGGRLQLSNPDGGGTRLLAEVPCES